MSFTRTIPNQIGSIPSAVGDQATFKHVYLGVAPFIVFDLIVLAALIAFPEIATWLPQRMIEG